MSEEIKKQYIAKKTVMGFVVVEDLKTPLGGEIIEVLYADGSKELMPKKTFNLIVSETERDESKAAAEKFKYMTRDILAVIADYDMKFFEMEYLITLIKNSILDNINRANNYLWTKDDSKHISGYDMLNEITLTNVQNILKDIPKTDDKPNS